MLSGLGGPGNGVEKRGYPRGQTTASRFKVLFAHVERVRDRRAAEAWLGIARIRPEELDDETRLFPLVALARAVDAFVADLGQDALAAAAVGFAERECLGLWSKLLRGTSAPEDAFVRLDGTESEYGRTTLWETIHSSPGRWRGRVRIAHDPELEASGNLARLRAAELSMVPCLFGFPRAKVRALPRTDGAGPEEYEVTWSVPVEQARLAAYGSVVASLVGGIPGAFAGAAYGVASALVSAAFGAAVGALVARERRTRVERLAQALRVAALERSLSLRELRETATAGDLVGTVVAGQYRLGRSMGSGATGVIYEAVRLADDVPVAVKLLRAGAAHDTVASDRLRRESEALGLAWHPNVVEVLDHGHLPDGSAYLVMELLRGESLADHLVRRGGRLAPDELLVWAVPVTEALAAVHAAGVIHRDLKPSNLFLARDDDGHETIKIIDFGIARVEWEEMRITNLGAPMGTPGYMAPEQEAGADVDARADLYSLGATFYECLVGEPPNADATGKLQAVTPERSAAAVGSGVHKSAQSLPPEWHEVLGRCLARSPDDRFQDARSLARALRALRAVPAASLSS